MSRKKKQPKYISNDYPTLKGKFCETNPKEVKICDCSDCLELKRRAKG